MSKDASVLTTALEPGENVLWQGHPKNRLMLPALVLLIAVFALFATIPAFSIYRKESLEEFCPSLTPKCKSFYEFRYVYLAVIIFAVLDGIHRIARSVRGCVDIIYAITERRVLLISNTFWRRIRSEYIKNVQARIAFQGIVFVYRDGVNSGRRQIRFHHLDGNEVDTVINILNGEAISRE